VGVLEPTGNIAPDGVSIQRLFAFQTVLDGVFERFTDLSEDDFDPAVGFALESIGRFVGADRAYVIRYDNEAQLTWMTHEWCGPGIDPSYDEEQGREFGEAPRQQARLEAFDVNEIRDVSALGPDWAADRDYLVSQGISAILEVPLVRQGELVGVIGLDSMSGAVPWTAEDVTMLRAVATLFAQVSERRVADDGLTAVAEQLRGTVRALQLAEDRFESLVDRLPLTVVRVTADGRTPLRNRVAQDDEVTAAALGADPAASPLRDAVEATLADATTRHVEYAGPDGGRTEWREASVRAELDPKGAVVSVLVVATDTTERHEHEAELVRAATHDALTGLPNRAMVDGLLEHASTAVGSTIRSVAVLFVDLDEFKLVNDSLGHRHGDEVLQAMAERFRAAVPPQGTVARLGGDEFAVLATWMNDESELAMLADRLQESLVAPISVQGAQVTVGVTVGYVVVDDLMLDARTALHAADVAMYRGKGASARRV